jgi:ribonuclease P protein component
MRNGSEFTAVVRRGRRAGRRTLVVHLSRASSTDFTEEPTRVGFVVSKAVGPAVVRNRVKRQLRHLTRDRLAALPSGSLVVIRANPAAAGASTLAADLESALASLMRKEALSGREPLDDSLVPGEPMEPLVPGEPFARGEQGES